MSFLDKVAAALTPAASDETRLEARRKAEELGTRERFVGVIVDHHKQIESLIDQAASATGSDARIQAMKEFERLLTGHATAEEAVVYPEIAEFDSKSHAGMGYEEHAMTKIQVAKLEKLDSMSEEWMEKLEHIRSALQQHMYQEEDSWLPHVAEKMPAPERERMTARFMEEFERYYGDDRAEITVQVASTNYV